MALRGERPLGLHDDDIIIIIFIIIIITLVPSSRRVNKRIDDDDDHHHHHVAQNNLIQDVSGGISNVSNVIAWIMTSFVLDGW